MMNISAGNDNLRIVTDRLILLPLNYRQLRKFLNNNLSLEKELELNPRHRVLSEKLEEILEEEIIVKVRQNPEQYYFHTIWLLIRKNDLTIVGDINCKDKPSVSGEIEIGYETIDAYQNLGYMTEAIAGFVNWLSTYYQVNTILAMTDDANFASVSVLKKNNFKPFLLAGNIIRWQKNIRNKN